MDASASAALIRTIEDLERDGSSIRSIRQSIACGDIVRVHPGRFIDGGVWARLFPEDRHLLRVVAADSARRGGEAVWSHVSAAALLGLPLFRHRGARPHLSGAGTNGRVEGRDPVRRHGVAVADADRIEVAGIACTSLERTVFDVIRTVGRETAVACADAALRGIAWREAERRFDQAATDAWRESLLDRIAHSPGVRGIRQARWVARFADGRSQLPGESVSRLYLNDLGFAPPQLQVPFQGPRGKVYAIDFGLDDVNAWGEFDGLGKYFDVALGGDPDGRKALLREKEREDWIRGRSGRAFVRWGMRHVENATTFSRHLASFGLAPRH